ncbi:4-(cytidine 5'-diphospho)-2-C-methyl-D-erythritol kinase [Alteribacillus iranensis]|uniref:4-(cytidine 5'-diphospho)-2-C-methyl-D-erythritol kinase n=1 Tax=Alteribacillus iranensis TaxID=930128 RepID=UPI000B839F44|nr:4-(cytidine 5'-diphospho)-2-C-methyl-D-erythritol kinase [Alteribacillus iranensis]
MKRSIKAPAKINLALDVLHKRDDGYHEVKMVMTQVDLADRIEIENREDGQIKVEMSEGFLPVDHRNLAHQAASLLKKRYEVKKGAHLYIHKHIPVAAGLAGGSSDAAAALKGLNEVWELGLSIEDLAAIGSEIGSDVAFCVHGGTALATGRGEVIETIESPPPSWVILAKPPIGVSTKEVYRRLEASEHTANGAQAERMVHAIQTQDYEAICENLYNVLETVTLPMYPEVKKIKDRMLDSGVDAALMSGSGPTVFGLIQKEARVNRVYNALRGFCEQVYAVRLISDKST